MSFGRQKHRFDNTRIDIETVTGREIGEELVEYLERDSENIPANNEGTAEESKRYFDGRITEFLDSRLSCSYRLLYPENLFRIHLENTVTSTEMYLYILPSDTKKYGWKPFTIKLRYHPTDEDMYCTAPGRMECPFCSEVVEKPIPSHQYHDGCTVEHQGLPNHSLGVSDINIDSGVTVIPSEDPDEKPLTCLSATTIETQRYLVENGIPYMAIYAGCEDSDYYGGVSDIYMRSNHQREIARNVYQSGPMRQEVMPYRQRRLRVVVEDDSFILSVDSHRPERDIVVVEKDYFGGHSGMLMQETSDEKDRQNVDNEKIMNRVFNLDGDRVGTVSREIDESIEYVRSLDSGEVERFLAAHHI